MISLCLITLNEGKNLEECLNQLKNYVDEIIIVDSKSTDKTVQIAEKYHARIFFRKFKDYSEQRNYAISKASYSWILMIDPDERCSPRLLNKLRELTYGKYDAYRIRWRNYCDKRLVVSTFKTILFKSQARFEGDLHERITNIDYKHKVYDKEIYITHTKTFEEQLHHLTLYRGIIQGLYKKSQGKDPRLDFLIKDHNKNVRDWLGKKYKYLLLNKK